MIGIIAWAAALGIGLVLGGVLAYNLVGQVRRLRSAMESARADVTPQLQALLAAPTATGRHSADTAS